MDSVTKIKEFCKWLIPTKYDFIEVVCKFKNHELDRSLLDVIHDENDLDKIYILECKRCRFEVSVRLDEDKDYYLVSDLC